MKNFELHLILKFRKPFFFTSSIILSLYVDVGSSVLNQCVFKPCYSYFWYSFEVHGVFGQAPSRQVGMKTRARIISTSIFSCQSVLRHNEIKVVIFIAYNIAAIYSDRWNYILASYAFKRDDYAWIQRVWTMKTRFLAELMTQVEKTVIENNVYRKNACIYWEFTTRTL